MKNLGLTIDRIIQVDPALKPTLTSIKLKWKKSPSKVMNFWQELIDFLNTPDLLDHPKRDELKSIVASRPRPSRCFYTFEHILATDRIVGFIPEHLSDQIKKYDRRVVDLAKKDVEATMTKNTNLMAYLHRQNFLLRIKYQRLWLALKDFFELWKNFSNYNIKVKGTALVLVDSKSDLPVPVKNQIPKIDITNIKKFLDYLGMGTNIEDDQQ